MRSQLMSHLRIFKIGLPVIYIPEWCVSMQSHLHQQVCFFSRIYFLLLNIFNCLGLPLNQDMFHYLVSIPRCRFYFKVSAVNGVGTGEGVGRPNSNIG